MGITYLYNTRIISIIAITYFEWTCSGESEELMYTWLAQPYLVVSRCDTINLVKKIMIKEGKNRI